MKKLISIFIVGMSLASVGLGSTSVSAKTKAAPKIKIFMMVETKGESTTAIPDTADGAQMAINEINRAGGITVNGVKRLIDYKRILTGGTSTLAETATRTALDQNPDILVGYIASAMVPGAAPLLKAANKPTIFLNTSSSLSLADVATVGWPVSYRMRPTQSALATGQFNFMYTDIFKGKLTKIGLICVQGAFGDAGCNAHKAFAAAKGVTITSQQSNAYNATDLSAQVTAICNSGAEAIISTNYPNPFATFANEMINQGCKLPVIEGASGDIGLLGGNVVKPPKDYKFYAASDCQPSASKSGTGKAFADKFLKVKKYTPGYSVAIAYDSIYLIKAAIEAGNGTDATSFSAGMAKQKYSGVCAAKYSPVKADGGLTTNILVNTSVVSTYDSKGMPTVVKTLVLPK